MRHLPQSKPHCLLAGQRIIEQMLPVLRDMSDRGPADLRNYSIMLNYAGQIKEALGQWDAARAGYAESLELRRQLRAALGDSPQTLRDLSIALNKVGGVDEAEGRLEKAKTAFAESLQITARLAEAYPDIPQYRADLNWVRQRLASINPAGQD